jgi:hypothetical protein
VQVIAVADQVIDRRDGHNALLTRQSLRVICQP